VSTVTGQDQTVGESINMHCPFCGHAAHVRTSIPLSGRYHQCRNIECFATFPTMEPIDEITQKDLPVPDIPLLPIMRTKYKDYPSSIIWN